MPSLTLEKFLQSPVVFYPGCGDDGHPVQFFNTERLASCFVYVDYLISEYKIKAALEKPSQAYDGRFLGYHSVERIALKQKDLIPDGWVPHVTFPKKPWYPTPLAKPFGFLEILERDADRDESHGAERLSILFLGGDGHASYDALFCQTPQRTPYAVVLQDHGFGGNYDRFGQGGLLETIAINTQTFPEFLLVATDTKAWEGYRRVPGIEGFHGGMHGQLRELYQRTDAVPPASSREDDPRLTL